MVFREIIANNQELNIYSSFEKSFEKNLATFHDFCDILFKFVQLLNKNQELCLIMIFTHSACTISQSSIDKRHDCNLRTELVSI